MDRMIRKSGPLAHGWNIRHFRVCAERFLGNAAKMEKSLGEKEKKKFVVAKWAEIKLEWHTCLSAGSCHRKYTKKECPKGVWPIKFKSIIISFIFFISFSPFFFLMFFFGCTFEYLMLIGHNNSLCFSFTVVCVTARCNRTASLSPDGVVDLSIHFLNEMNIQLTEKEEIFHSCSLPQTPTSAMRNSRNTTNKLP